MKSSNYINKIYKRENQVGTLKKTLVERTKGKKYIWIEVLAFLDNRGRWLYTEYWKLNQGKKADIEIKSLGYKEIEEINE